MHIALFYQYYHTYDCAATARHYTFIREWVHRHTVSVITSDVWASKRLTERYAWVPEGVRVVHIHAPYDNRMGPARRAVAFSRYAAGALWAGLRMPRPDVIIGTSPPLTAAWTAATVSRQRGIPWVFEVQDLWPDFPVQMGAVPIPWVQRRFYAMEQALYDRADHLIPLSPDMAAHLYGKGCDRNRVTLIHQGTDFPLIEAWTDERVDALRREASLEGCRVVLYGGAFGRANDIPTLLETAARLAHRNDLRFVFIGRGYHAPDVTRAAERQSNLLVLPPQPRHRMLGWFRLADVSIVSFLGLPVLAANAPAKFCDSLGAGTPVIVTNPGWTKTFVETHRCGWYTPASDPEALAHTLTSVLADPVALKEAGARGQAIARERFDRQRLARRFEDLLYHIVHPT